MTAAEIHILGLSNYEFSYQILTPTHSLKGMSCQLFTDIIYYYSDLESTPRIQCENKFLQFVDDNDTNERLRVT
jgi:hypothetical protein